MSSALNPRFKVSYFTLEAFKFTGYDKVLFIDADILVLGDLKSLVKRDLFTGISNSLQLYTKNRDCGPGKETPLYINGGVFSIPGKIAGPELFQQLLDIAKPGWPKCDQDTINEWLKRTDKVYCAITNRFNCMVRAAAQRFKSIQDLNEDGVRILHYAGKFKPWLLDPHSPFLHLEKHWLEFYHKHFGKLSNE
jgi:lipopolysaccharide biosynthesis glycosyltransferase